MFLQIIIFFTFFTTFLVHLRNSFIAAIMKLTRFYILPVFICLLSFETGFALESSDESQSVTAFTMSDMNNILQDIAFEVILQSGEATYSTAELLKADYLIPLASFIDLNVIGKGTTVTLNKEKMVKFIIKTLEKGKDLKYLSSALVEAFSRADFASEQKSESGSGLQREKVSTRIGGYAVGEFEFHQEPDGEYLPLMEINQIRLFFSAQLSPADAKNHVGFFAEWNPVPEEIIHQIEAAPLETVGINDTLRSLTPIPEEQIKFEQLYIKVGNIEDSGIDITFGQIRNPFGLWSDYTSHRNFTSTKNNTLVNNFALKKIELGLLVEKKFAGGVDIAGAIVHGRTGRTSNLDRADGDKAKDFVGRIRYTKNNFGLGVSAYLSEFSLNKNYAYGLDWQYLTPNLSLSGEVVFQKNNDREFKGADSSGVQGTIPAEFTPSSFGSYVQFNYLLSNRLSFYGLYETWRFYVNGDIVDKPTYKAFQGFKYQINQRTRWTIVEFGWMFHHNFDEGNLHLSTQIEVTY